MIMKQGESFTLLYDTAKEKWNEKVCIESPN